MSNIEKQEITSELSQSYLQYAMSVIVSRALPDVRDGLKPVQRRILWGMWDSGVTATSKFRKSANVVGEVMGRYHPHGDSAIYDAMVRLTQEFSLRYPLIHGQGNFGSIDGDAAAAMRYTEAKLAKIADEMLEDIDKETVSWGPNYDGTREEPRVLPARLPNLLLNGALGIAVGMATSIPPHNLREIAEAIIYLADNPKATSDDLLEFVKGPDFPTGGVIFDKKAIREAYLTGKGAVTLRAKTDVEERKKGAFDIVVTEIPYMVNKSELIKEMAELVTDKRIEGIKDIRDESDREGLRIAIELKNDAPPQKVLNQLFKHTNLQKDFHFNMIALVNGIEPRLLSLKDILHEYVEHRKIMVRKRTEFDLKKAKERAHILEGLSKALSNIDKVIQTIKKSDDKDAAKVNLMKQFKFTEIQAAAILDMRLQTLANLEHEKIDNELAEKMAFIAECEAILKSPAKILTIVKNEVKDLAKIYGDDRRTAVVATGIGEFKDEDLIPEEKTIITLSAGGYVKRMPPDNFQAQHRGGKGLIGSGVGDEDFLTQFVQSSTHDDILFFTTKGRVFQTKVYEIPAASRTAKGRAIQNFLELPPEEEISAIVTYSSKDAKQGDLYFVMVTERGVIKKTALKDFQNIRRTGIIAINLQKGDILRWVGVSRGKDEMILVTEQGQSIRFKEAQVRPMGRTAAGIRAIKLRGQDKVAGFDILAADAKEENKGARLLVVMEHGFGKRTPLKEYKIQGRGGSGIRTANVTAKTGKVISSKVVIGETDLFALSAKGQIIRTPLESVRETGRAAQGVRVMNLNPGDKLAAIVLS
jgi:DNA gyrase subunit A